VKEAAVGERQPSFLAHLRKEYRSSDKAGYVMVLPYVLHFLIFVAYPLVFAFILVFCRWDIVTPMEFIGLRNIQRLINDTTFWTAVTNTLKFLVLHIPLQIVLALLIAVVLNGPIKLRGFFRSAFFLPFVISGAVVTILWQQLYSTDAGVFNLVLTRLGLDPVPWLTDPAIAIYLYCSHGHMEEHRFLHSALSGRAPKCAARALRGCEHRRATKPQQFWKITLPLLRPSLFLWSCSLRLADSASSSSRSS